MRIFGKEGMGTRVISDKSAKFAATSLYASINVFRLFSTYCTFILFSSNVASGGR